VALVGVGVGVGVGVVVEVGVGVGVGWVEVSDVRVLGWGGATELVDEELVVGSVDSETV
jgi:hypothetical protein